MSIESSTRLLSGVLVELVCCVMSPWTCEMAVAWLANRRRFFVASIALYRLEYSSGQTLSPQSSKYSYRPRLSLRTSQLVAFLVSSTSIFFCFSISLTVGWILTRKSLLTGRRVCACAIAYPVISCISCACSERCRSTSGRSQYARTNARICFGDGGCGKLFLSGSSDASMRAAPLPRPRGMEMLARLFLQEFDVCCLFASNEESNGPPSRLPCLLSFFPLP
mmetsp:Transcript_8303/g.19049  ORF Transcript_8303/g.19049 Transcript_8303/m.19049 type:complete len:222 (-) Transcript_8303:250-915(-)